MRRGAVVRIALRSFLTYDDLTVCPGEQLNLVIGPNGTGKSTLVAALVLGLGGSPSVLARSGQLGHFVKDGYDQASVQVELYDPEAGGGNPVVERHFDRAGRSTWRLNGETATLKRVLALVKELHIQVDNLCQVLPQERVQDFSRLDAEGLLENTERAVGYPGMLEDHQLLRQVSTDVNQLEQRISSAETTLENHKQKLANLQAVADNQTQRKKYETDIVRLKQRLEWLRYEQAAEQVTTAEEERRLADERVQQAEQQLLPLRQAFQLCETQADGRKKLVTELSGRLRNGDRKCVALRSGVEQEEEALQRGRVQYEAAINADRERLARVQSLQEKLQYARTQLEEVSERATSGEPRLRELEQQMRELSVQVSGRQERREEYERRRQQLSGRLGGLQSELRRLEDTGDQRLQLLRRRNADVYRAVCWLRENRQRFSSTVHEPIVLLLQVKDRRYAKYVQSAVPYRDQLAFTCETREDMNTFMEQVRDGLQLRVSCVLSDPRCGVDSFRPQHSRAQLAAVGFTHTVADLFTAPDAVRCYLLSTCNLHNVAVVDVSEDRAPAIMSSLDNGIRISTYMIGNTRYHMRRSRYSQLDTISSEQLRPVDEIYTTGVDVKRVQQLRQHVEESSAELEGAEVRLKELQQGERDDTTALEQLRQQKKEGAQLRDVLRRLQLKIRSNESSLRECESGAVDLGQLQTEMEAEQRRRLQSQTARLSDFTRVCTEQLPVLGRHRAAKRQLQLVGVCKTAARSALQQRTADTETVRAAARQVGVNCEARRRDAAELRAAALRLLDLVEGSDVEARVQRTLTFTGLSAEELETAMRDREARLEMLDGGAEERAAVAEYERLTAERRSLRHRLNEQRAELVALRQRSEAVSKRWHTALRGLVQQVSRAFSDFFQQLGCAGEVLLKRGEGVQDENDVTGMGVSVRVQYRSAEPLCELSASHHSGGERSVATMVYLMSLQALDAAGVPFRCVDEINQGMDERNERRMFDFLMRTACRSDQGQYFMITPKLLSGLQFPDGVTVLCVYNSPTMLSHRRLDVGRFCTARRKRKHSL